MKAKFYFIDELKVYVRLSSITSFKLEKPLKQMGDEHLKCCIIADKSIYWCESRHFHSLKNEMV